MIYVLIGLVVIIALLRMMLPTRYAVHASRAVELPAGVSKEGHWPFAGFVRDEAGKPVDVQGKFVGHAVGGSMTAFGIPAGATFIGDYFSSDAERLALVSGEIVVVDGEAEFSESGLRLRVIKSAEGDGTVSFMRDGYGRQPRNRPTAEVHARVTYVIENDRHGSNEWIAAAVSSIRRLFSHAA